VKQSDNNQRQIALEHTTSIWQKKHIEADNLFSKNWLPAMTNLLFVVINRKRNTLKFPVKNPDFCAADLL
jgi:hypothetical protein